MATVVTKPSAVPVKPASTVRTAPPVDSEPPKVAFFEDRNHAVIDRIIDKSIATGTFRGIAGTKLVDDDISWRVVGDMTVHTRGALVRDHVRMQVNTRSAELKRCIKDATIETKFTVMPDGSVTSVAAKTSDPTAASCVARELGKVAVNPPKNLQPVRVTMDLMP